ncbi:MAG TPA: hypothetical protein VN903_32975 [Polyangia bacterium]|jgi:hypothetical protein|nr:hypothetical protein [Polyangia bacterium]
MSRARSTGWLVVWVVVGLSAACSIAIRRDLSAVPAGQVGFDDMCGLQEYFDTLEIKTSAPPRVVTSRDIEGSRGGKEIRGGQERFAFENDFQLKHLKRVLNENWRRLPETVGAATAIEIEVKWTEKAGAKRVATDEDAAMTIAGETFSLPYHICLSELLYGEPLYRQRRVMWGLPLPAISLGPPAVPDGGWGGRDAAAPEAGRPDGGAPRTDQSEIRFK